jgi:hypothetical protein
MNAHLQRIEGKRVADGNGEFTVDHESRGAKALEHRHDLGEVPRERLA